MPFADEAKKNTLIPKWLYEIKLIDGSLYFCGGAESVVYQGKTYLASGIKHGDITSSAELKTSPLTVPIQDAEGILTAIVSNNEMSGIIVSISLIFLVKNEESGKYEPAEDDDNFSADYKISGTTKAKQDNTRIVIFNLEPPFADDKKIPGRTFLKNFCSWEFKSLECGYTGTGECAYSIESCQQLGNERRFGGFPGIPGQRMRII